MLKKSIKVSARASISLYGLIQRRKLAARPLATARAAGFLGRSTDAIRETDPMAVIVEGNDAAKIIAALHRTPAAHAAQVVQLSQRLFSVNAGEQAIAALLRRRDVLRIQTKKRKTLHLDAASIDIGLRAAVGKPRAVTQDGTGVLIGIIDSGFDLSHPMFRDKSGKLRVEGLLVQRGDQTPQQFTAAQVAKGWGNGTNPGADEGGHGTHVASIAGGSAWKGYEGIAPGSRFLLVKTDFVNTDKAVRWIYDKAGTRPCVVNMSLGHHWGAHDGTDAEERFHADLAAQNPGKVICISAGNEREDLLHIGGDFAAKQKETVGLTVFPSQNTGDAPHAALTFWHDERDEFSVTLVSPAGTRFDAPVIGQLDEYQAPKVNIQIGRDTYAWSNLIQTQVVLDFVANAHPVRDLQGWKLEFTCKKAVVGRLDGWFANSGMGRFTDRLLESARTVGLSATGEGCLAVSSHVSKDAWTGDMGKQRDARATVGESSYFSSLGPTRDGRHKPDISAPGEMVTAALAGMSEMATSADYAAYRQSADRLLTIQGTSMACPVITGVVALLLQKKPTLTTAHVREILQATARNGAGTGADGWHPAYGYGKVDVAKALALVPPP